MNFHRVLGNMGAAAIAQGVSLIVSLCQSLLVPNVLGVTGFGYWQLFIFYFNYAEIFQFGLNDGVYLLKGGETRSNLDKREVSSELAFGLFFQTIIALIIVFLSVAMQPESQRLFVLIACGVLMPLYNAACFLQYLLQAIDETRTYSKSIIIDRAIMMALLLVLLLFRTEAFEFYVYAFCVGKVVQILYLLIKTKGILAAGLLSFKESSRVSWSTMRVGIKLMIGNMASALILGIMRFAIDGYWGIEVFGKVSLALSMANFFLVFVTQVTRVLFPTLRQMNGKQIMSFYSSVENALEIILPAILLCYLPAKVILGNWLPDYAESFEYLGLLMPLCLFNGKMNALYSNMFKVRRMEVAFLIVNVVTMVISALLAVFGAFVINSLDFVLISGDVSIIFRSAISCALLSKNVLGNTHVDIGDIVLSLIFVSGAMTLSDGLSFLLYACAYAVYLAIRHSSVKRLRRDAIRARQLLRDEDSVEKA